MLLNTIRYQILAYWNREITLQALREWLAPITMDAASAADEPSQQLAMQLIGDFSDFDEGFIAEPALRQKLFNVISPFASSSVTYDLGFSLAIDLITTGTFTNVPDEEQVAA